MPNWITNYFIEVKQPAKLESFIINKDDEVDFNIISPMPKSLNLFSGDDKLETKQYYKYVNQAKTFEEYIDIINKTFKYNLQIMDDYDKLPKNDIKLMQIYKEVYTTWNFLNYGYRGWYDWRCANWGCKWNACETSGLSFQTPWAVPYHWLKQLAQKCNFVLIYADEDIGANCGIVEAKDGIINIYNSPYVTDASTVFAYCVQCYEINEQEFYDSEGNTDENRGKYLEEHKYELLEQFCKEIGCLNIYKRIKKDLVSCW